MALELALPTGWTYRQPMEAIQPSVSASSPTPTSLIKSLNSNALHAAVLSSMIGVIQPSR